MELLDVKTIAEWAFMGTVGTASAMIVKFLGNIHSSVERLNSKVAIVIERTDRHEKELDKHDGRINRLERTPKR